MTPAHFHIYLCNQPLLHASNSASHAQLNMHNLLYIDCSQNKQKQMKL